MIVHGYSFSDGRFVRSANAQADQMNPGEYLIPGYHTPDPQPDASWLQDGEYFAYLNENGEPPRRYQDGAWEIRTESHPLTAWRKVDGSPEQFDDASEVPEDYTTAKPATRFDYWNETGWVTDEQAQFEAEVKSVNDIRRQKYSQISDPLLSESLMLRELGEVIAADATKQQALEWYEKIKQDHPWPENPNPQPPE